MRRFSTARLQPGTHSTRRRPSAQNAQVKQSGATYPPFPAADDLPEPKRARAAAAHLVGVIDRELGKAAGTFAMNGGDDTLLSEIDKWAYEYFCLSKDEIILIEIDRIVPAVQPHQGSFPKLWHAPTEAERHQYAASLIGSVGDWLEPGAQLRASLEARNADLGVLRLSLSGGDDEKTYTEESNAMVGDTLSKIMQHIHQPIGGNFQLMPDLKLFIGKDLYLVKPMQRRFWLQSTALADADAIAGDLQQAIELDAHRASAG